MHTDGVIPALNMKFSRGFEGSNGSYDIENKISARAPSTSSLVSSTSSSPSSCSSSPLSGLLGPNLPNGPLLFDANAPPLGKSSSGSDPLISHGPLSPGFLPRFGRRIAYSVSVNMSDSSSDSPSGKSHKRLDRSFSEPVEKVSNNNNSKCSPGNNRSQADSSRYKTELCRPFEENGSCRYGDKCQFAHGEEELRTLQRHPKYKTELCRTFHTTGFCPYGPRCHFIHNSEESKKNFLNSYLLCTVEYKCPDPLNTVFNCS